MATKDRVPEQRELHPLDSPTRPVRHFPPPCLLCLTFPFSCVFWFRAGSKLRDTTTDISRTAQLRDIDASFAAIESSELDTLRHPTRPELTAVEAFDILPDSDIWANAYDLFRFSERPGDRALDVRVRSFVLFLGMF